MRETSRTRARRRPPVDAEADVRRHRQVREEGVVLEHHPHAPLLRRHPRAVPGDAASGDVDRAGVRRLEAGDQPQERRLAAPGRAEQRDELAAIGAQRGVDDRRRRPEPLRHALGMDHRTLHVRQTLQQHGAQYTSEWRSMVRRCLSPPCTPS